MPTKFRVDLARCAEVDIQEILAYIAKDSPIRAEAFIDALQHQIRVLEQFPMRCPLIPENDNLDNPYRQLIYGHYRTIFRIFERTVYVVRVIHHARLLTMDLL